MVLTVEQALLAAQHTLGSHGGGALSPELDAKRVLNQAGEWLYSAHPWKWLERSSVQLSLRNSISFTGAEFDPTSFGLTAAGTEFDDYVFVPGDKLRITGGDAEAVPGEYYIVRVAAGVIFINQDITTDAASTDMNGTVDVDRVALPSDFRELIGYEATESLVNSLQLTSFQHLLELRTSQVTLSSWNFWAAITHGRAVASGTVAAVPFSAASAPTPVLEIWPGPSSTATPVDGVGQFTIFYRGGWDECVSDQQEILCPSYLDSLLIFAARAFFRGYEEDEPDQPSLHARLGEIMLSPLWRTAIERDGAIQPDMGMLRGGMVQSGAVWFDWGFHSTVSGPT